MSFNIHNYSNGNFEEELEQAMIASVQDQVKPSYFIKSSSNKKLAVANRILNSDDYPKNGNSETELEQAIRASLKEQVKPSPSSNKMLTAANRILKTDNPKKDLSFSSLSSSNQASPISHVSSSFSSSSSSNAIGNAECLAPIRPDGAALFTYNNNSGTDDQNIFIQVVGVNPHTRNQCFIKYDNHGNPTYCDVLKKMDSKNYAFPLSNFPQNSQGNARSLYLPHLDGARVYTSVGQKMSFSVVQNEKGVWTINAPNPLNPHDPNRDILWDKTEFAVNPHTVFINPTAVDDFSLPLHCEERGRNGTKQSGGITASRAEVFKLIKTGFERAGAPWTKLISKAPSRIYSPMYGAATGLFPQNYFVSSGWIDAFKKVFSKTPLQIDAEESLPIHRGGGIWNGIIDPTTNVMTFNRVVDSIHPPIPPCSISLPIKTSELIAGCGPSWKIKNGNPLQALFARDISCAIDTNTLTTLEPLNKRYFERNSAQFYHLNPIMPEALQFIDHYSKALHSFGNHQIYTIPYDDETGQSGAASYTPKNYKGGSISLGPL